MQEYIQFREQRSSIINAINSPLGFFALSLLIVEGFLGIVLIFSGLENNGKFWGMIIGTGLFVLVVVIVSLLVAFKPKNITFGQESHLMEEGKYPPYGEKEDVISKRELLGEPKTENTKKGKK